MNEIVRNKAMRDRKFEMKKTMRLWPRSLKAWRELALAILTATSLCACGPSAEQKAQIAEQQRLRCLDNFCEGDIEPERDREKEAIFKRGGKWFVIPKEYGTGAGPMGFYWPSKTPFSRINRETEAPELHSRGPGLRSNSSDVSIDFFIETRQQKGEMYDEVLRLEREGLLIKQEHLREGLDVVLSKPQPSGLENAPLYIATQLKTPTGSLPTISCRESDPNGGACTGGFQWKPGLQIYIRFSAAHGRDWPEIYSEIIRVLNLVREA